MTDKNMRTGLRPAVFFDRDGVVNLPPAGRYITRWAEFTFTPGIASAIALCRQRAMSTVLVSNQRGVFTGETPPEALEQIHSQMQDTLGAEGAAFDAIYVATGDRDDPRRKPAPAMMLEAAADLGIDLGASIMVGDHDKDMLAARAAGIGTTVRFVAEKPVGVPADYTVKTGAELQAVFDEILPGA